MQALIKPLLTYLIYPLARDVGQWIYNKYIKNKSDNERRKLVKQKQALKRAIRDAKTDDDIRALSELQHNLNRHD